jgi:hypothetical protein
VGYSQGHQKKLIQLMQTLIQIAPKYSDSASRNDANFNPEAIISPQTSSGVLTSATHLIKVRISVVYSLRGNHARRRHQSASPAAAA